MGSSQSSTKAEQVHIQTHNSTLARRRVENERKYIQNNPPVNWKIVTGSEWNVWDVWIVAPPTCPFHSTPFKITLTFTYRYPNELPEYKLPNPHRFYHPNIQPEKGLICENTFKEQSSLVTIRDRIEAFITLLSIPNPKSAYNTDAARDYMNDQRVYYRKAFNKFHA